MVPSDILSIRGYGETSVSPDGRFIAIEVIRARNEDSSRVRIDYVSRSNLWIVRRDGSGRRRVLPDRPSVVNSWHPTWSPTGRYLAFLSSTRHANAFVNIWDARTGVVRRLTTGPVDLASGIGRGSADADHHVCWLDSTHLVVVTLPPDAQALDFHEDVQSVEIAHRSLATVNGGQIPTVVVAASPADSGTQPSEPQASLLLLDARNGAVRPVGVMPATQTRVANRFVIISRNGRWAAVVVHLHPTTPDPLIGWTMQTNYPAQLGVVPLVGGPDRVRWVGGVSPYTGITSTYCLPFSWTLNDSALAFLSFVDGGPKATPADREPLQINLLDPETLSIRPVALWSARRAEDDPLEPVGLAWTPDGDLEMRTRSHALWRVSRDSVSPAMDNGQPVRMSSGADDDLRIQKSPDGRLLATDSSGKAWSLFPAINSQLNAIEPPHYLPLQYRNAKGDTLHATVLLPYHYDAGRRYPTVVWVYAGEYSGAGIDRFAERDFDNFLNLLPLSGHGYVVLEPSIPIGPLGVATDPMRLLNDGVDPAVDSLIAMGIADSTRLALMGHSYGGYTVFGMLTATHRYKTAIAMMGIAELISLYGRFDVRHRYTEPNAAALGPVFLEKGQARMGSPLWQDPQRYVRNSPLFYTDKIDTPLLIVDGSMDLLSDQSEEMFSALYRLRRRAEIRTYVGEGHSLESPANILDIWTRMLSWLDRYLLSTGA